MQFFFSLFPVLFVFLEAQMVSWTFDLPLRAGYDGALVNMIVPADEVFYIVVLQAGERRIQTSTPHISSSIFN